MSYEYCVLIYAIVAMLYDFETLMKHFKGNDHKSFANCSCPFFVERKNDYRTKTVAPRAKLFTDSSKVATRWKNDMRKTVRTWLTSGES